MHGSAIRTASREEALSQNGLIGAIRHGDERPYTRRARHCFPPRCPHRRVVPVHRTGPGENGVHGVCPARANRGSPRVMARQAYGLVTDSLVCRLCRRRRCLACVRFAATRAETRGSRRPRCHALQSCARRQCRLPSSRRLRGRRGVRRAAAERLHVQGGRGPPPDGMVGPTTSDGLRNAVLRSR